MDKKVLLSTDIGSDIDDALSLTAAINAGIDLQGVYTVNGDVNSRAYIAKHMIDLAGKNISVGIGESRPLVEGVNPYYYFEDCYIDNKFIDEEKSQFSRNIVYKRPVQVKIAEDGILHMAQSLEQQKHTVFSIGPLTNIARILEFYPESARNIDKMYVMGCRFSSEITQEHNIRHDISAAQRVLESTIPLVIVPGDLCSQFTMPVSQIERLASPMGRYVHRMARGFIAAKTAQTFLSEGLGDLILREKSSPKAEEIIKELGREKASEVLTARRGLITNLNDSNYAAYDPEEYFKQYNSLIEHLRDPRMNYQRGTPIANMLKMAIPSNLSVADVFVPYCFLNPDKIKTRRANVSVDEQGISHETPGEKHEIVTSVDFNDFRRFLEENLRDEK